MHALKRWAHKLCPSRRRRKQKQEDDEREKREQQQQDAREREKLKQDAAREREQQLRMLLTLRDLERTMDPLIAAQVYNKKHSPIGQLPEELLLQILHHLGDDTLTLYCLRRVSRTFRRLINLPDIWEPVLIRLQLLRECCYSLGCITEHESMLPGIHIHLAQRLQKDGMCDRCISWCDVPGGPGSRLTCQFRSLDSGGVRLRCDACGSEQDVQAFPSSDQQPDKLGERRCLACQGAVQLCEHVHICWATVEAHIADWQQRRPGDWQGCFDHFDVIECHDPSHDTRCTADEAPTWPRARLRAAGFDPKLVVLNLEWEPHSGLDIFTFLPGGRVPAPELRALFRRYRQEGQPAGVLLPSYPSNPLPEMTCFDPNKCLCLHYEMGDNGKKPLPSAAASAKDPSGQHIGKFVHDEEEVKCGALHYHGRRYGRGRNGAEVSMIRHWPRGNYKREWGCLKTKYQRDVLVCKKTDSDKKLTPTHEWLHAMDPDTYPRPHDGYTLPLCKDKGCMNYYKRPRSLTCINDTCRPWKVC
ncbi:hypothetical protein QBC46DRAFT_437390 [Diplogelasinospora grovesii]|uniref:F-box domain-containing protein n=1 Tax=Diplogelasinospora grovesii TaxID=303347 RepID=A0AAN6NJD8_9PEZI|nr:hypothetical protein QBC46DRAFT_437390 [Diplogelasinospora grovesii]